MSKPLNLSERILNGLFQRKKELEAEVLAQTARADRAEAALGESRKEEMRLRECLIQMTKGQEHDAALICKMQQQIRERGC